MFCCVRATFSFYILLHWREWYTIYFSSFGFIVGCFDHLYLNSPIGIDNPRFLLRFFSLHFVFLIFFYSFFPCFSLFLVFLLFFSSSLRCMLTCFTLSRVIFNVLYHFRVARSSDLIFFSRFFIFCFSDACVFFVSFTLFFLSFSCISSWLFFFWSVCDCVCVCHQHYSNNRQLFFSASIIFLSFSENLFDFIFLSIDIELMRVQ